MLLLTWGGWFVFKDTPERQISRWRKEVSRSLFGETLDLARAEEFNARVLRMMPRSVQDLAIKARINERKGTHEGYLKCLEACDEILSFDDPRVLPMALLKADVSSRLGRFAEASAALLSIVDSRPFEAFAGLGGLALDQFAAREAVRYFSKARSVARSEDEKARAGEGLASAYLLVGSSSDSGQKARPSADTEAGKTSLPAATPSQKKAGEILDEVEHFLRDDYPTVAGADLQLLSYIGIVRRLAALRSEVDLGKEYAFPYQTAVLLLDEKLKTLKSVSYSPSAGVRIQKGALLLRCATLEGARLPEGKGDELRGAADKEFAAALAFTPEEALRLLASVKAGEWSSISDAQREMSVRLQKAMGYVRGVSQVCLAYLDSPQVHRILDDPSALQLSRRLADGMKLDVPEVRAGFGAIEGLAQLKAGSAETGDSLLGAYIDSAEPAVRPMVAVLVAEQVVRHLPGNSFVFQCLDRFRAAGGKPADLLSRRLMVLVAARKEPALAEEAARRIATTLDEARSQAENPEDRGALALVLRGLQGTGAALEFVRATVAKFPADRASRRFLADLAVERGAALAASGEVEAARHAFFEALKAHLTLYARNPLGTPDTVDRIRSLLARMQKGDAQSFLETWIQESFPGAGSTAGSSFAPALLHFFSAEHGAALDRLDAVASEMAFKPFSEYVRGAALAGLAGDLRRQALDVSLSEELRSASRRQAAAKADASLRAFRAGGELPACRYAVLTTELERVAASADVPKDLQDRIDAFCSSPGGGYGAYLLRAQEFLHRLRYLYGRPGVRNVEVVRAHRALEHSLRQGIRQYPMFNTFYLLLAEALVIEDELVSEGAGGRGPGRLGPAEYAKAINLLKAVPVPDTNVLRRLVAYLRHEGQIEGARRYLEALALALPDVNSITAVLENYLRSDPASLRALCNEDGAIPDGTGVLSTLPRERQEKILALRAAAAKIPEWQAVRFSFLAQATEVHMTPLSSSVQRDVLRRRVVELYSKSLAAYKARDLEPALVVLNNLAWRLAEVGEAESVKRAVAVAREAVARVGTIRAQPEVFDTYAWALYRGGRLEEARKVWEDILSAFDRPSFRYHHAVLLLDLREFDSALAEVRKALHAGVDFAEKPDARALELRIIEARQRALGE